MPAFVCLLRAVNLAGRNRVDMGKLRAVCGRLGFQDARTYLQSGNLIFTSLEGDAVVLAGRLESAIQQSFGFRTSVVIRTATELRDVVRRNPFAVDSGLNPSKLLLTFLAGHPGADARKALLAMQTEGEEIHCRGRELYIYFPNGVGRSKLFPKLDRILGVPGTARNWNTVLKLLQIAEELEAG